MFDWPYDEYGTRYAMSMLFVFVCFMYIPHRLAAAAAKMLRCYFCRVRQSMTILIRLFCFVREEFNIDQSIVSS